MAQLAPLTLRVAAKPLRRFVLLDAGPYRLEGEGVRREFMFAAGLVAQLLCSVSCVLCCVRRGTVGKTLAWDPPVPGLRSLVWEPPFL
jgi:hypothetical protein